jgi:Tfp pilus assembly protein PilF
VQEGEAALMIAPETPGLHVQLGEAYLETGAVARGMVELERALKLGYAHPGFVHLMRARGFLMQQDRTRAKREVEAALREDPELAAQAEALHAP